MVGAGASRLVTGVLLVLLSAAVGGGVAGAQPLIVRHLAGALGGPDAADGVGSLARFNAPWAVATDANGTMLFVADSSNRTIRQIDVATRTVTTLAGSAGELGTADGAGSAARFGSPMGIASNAAGTVVFVADSYWGGIRRIDVATRMVTTLAGGSGSFGWADGVGTAASFYNPYSVATDAAGSVVFVADTNNNTIRRIDTASGLVTTLAGLHGTSGSTDAVGTAARFAQPYSVATDAAGSVVFVADFNNCTIRRIDVASGTVTTLAGSSGMAGTANGVGTAARFNYPGGVGSDSAGATVYVADSISHTIRRIDVASRTATTLAGTAGAFGDGNGVGTSAQFFQPYGVAVDANDGSVFVGDTWNAIIRRIDVASTTVSTLAGASNMWGRSDGVGAAATFSGPNGIAADAAARKVFVADVWNQRIRQIDVATRTVTTLAGHAAQGSADGVGSAASFTNPTAVATNAAGTVVFVADRDNCTIRKIDVATRTVTTLAGLAGEAGSDDGIGSAARFAYPTGLASNAAGTVVFVADEANSTIRRLDVATGAVTTLAGQVGSEGHADGVGTNAQFYDPTGVATDALGTVVFVADINGYSTYDSTIRRIDVATATVTTLGNGATFNSPHSVATDAAGTVVYVAVEYTHVISRIDVASGAVTTVVGLADHPGSVDGVGAAARLQMPMGVAVDSYGRRLFVCDHNNAVRFAVPIGAPRDFDGDSLPDVAVYRPGSGTWFSLDSSTGNQTYRYHGWGVQAQGDTPVRGDFDGDGILDPVVFRPLTGTWFILKSASNFTDWEWFGWGDAADILMPADYDGDGVTDAAVFRPSNGKWFIRPSSGASTWLVEFGTTGDVPVPGDFDGDGKADIVVYRPASGTWFILTSSSNFTQYYYRGWGVQAENDTPVPGDYDGDGKTDCAVYRPANGTWFILKSSSNDTDWLWDGWGSATDTLVPADYDGDGKADLAVYRPANGTWYIKPSSGATQWSVVFGQSGDVVLQGIR